MKIEQIECSKMSAYKIQTPENYPEESIQHSEQGESLKSRIFNPSMLASVHYTDLQFLTSCQPRYTTIMNAFNPLAWDFFF